MLPILSKVWGSPTYLIRSAFRLESGWGKSFEDGVIARAEKIEPMTKKSMVPTLFIAK